MAKFKTGLVKEYKEKQAFQQGQEKLKEQHNITDEKVIVVEKSNMANYWLRRFFCV